MERRSRTLELALVLLITVLPDIFQSTVEVLNSYKPFQPVAAYLVYGVVRCVSAIALVVYVLARSDRTIRDIGVNFEPRDLLRALGIWCTGIATYYVSYYGVTMAVHSVSGIWCEETVRNVSFLFNESGRDLVAVLAFSVAGAMFEEVVVRAYVQTEVTYLTSSPMIAMFTSIALQTSYHFYQGWFAALVLDMPLFIVYAIYYTRTKNVVPIVIAHVATDVCSILFYR